MNHRIETLTFFRFVAAIIVVIFHYGRKATGLGGVLASGPQMVTFFFVLSGFVMALSYFPKNNFSAASYWWARISRIMPAYLLALALMVMYICLDHAHLNKISLMLNLLLLQSWFPPHPLSINSVGWSLSVEAFFYLTFPMILVVIKRNNYSALQILSLAAILWAGTQAVLAYLLFNGYYKEPPSSSHDLIYYFPLSHYCSFLLGIAGGMWFVSHDFRVRNQYHAAGIVCLAAMLVVSALNHQSEIASYLGFFPAFGSSFFAPLFLLFVCSIAICQTSAIALLGAKPLVLLGEASYSLYILQEPAYQFYTRNLASTELTAQSNFYAYLVFMVMISILSFLIFERPANNYMRSSLPRLLTALKRA